MQHKNSLAILTVWALGMVGWAASAQGQTLEEAWKALPAYKMGENRKGMDVINEAVVKAVPVPAERAAIARKLAACLGGEATFEARDFCCRQLFLCATADEVPALAKLLGDEKLSHMGRYVLERMTDPAAGAALRAALGTLKGNLRIGVINSLGARRDAEAAAELIKLLGGADPAIAAAAAGALGKIGGADAIKALAAQKSNANVAVNSAVIDAYLTAADELLKSGKKAEAAAIYEELRAKDQPARIQLAALRGLSEASVEKALPIVLVMLKGEDATAQAMAGGFARQMAGENVTKALVEAMGSMPSSGQVVLLDVLAGRGDKAARPAVLAAVGSTQEAVCVAAITALASLGEAGDVKLLAEIAAAKPGPVAEAAKLTLTRIPGAETDKAIAELMSSSTGGVRVGLLRALGVRRATSVVPMVLGIAEKDADEAVRVAALDALGQLADDKDFPALVARLATAKTDGERNAAKNAMAMISVRMKNRDDCVVPILATLEKADPATKAILLSSLTTIGGEKALNAVRAAMKDTDATVKEAAIRALTQWPEAAAVPDMLELAKSDNQKYRVLALRGLVSVISKSPTLSGAQSLKIYKQALDAATRPEDKRLILAGVAEVKDAAALQLVVSFLADDGLKNEAATAVIRIAKNSRNKNAALKTALEKVIASNADENLKKEAKGLLDKSK